MTLDDTVPVTVLTGFLGAGKTTLLNRLLGRPEMEATAVLINEFGEVGLDHLLVEALDGEAVLLAAGCLCCTIRGDLVRALRGVLARMDAGQRVRRVVVETTGLADPAPILQTLMASSAVTHTFRLDGVVTLVDAVNGAAALDAQPEAVKQAAVADRIVLSKTDLATGEAAAALEARLRALNPGAPVLRALRGAVEPAALFDVGPFAPGRKPPDVRRWLAEEAYADRGHDHGPTEGHGGGRHHRRGHDRNRHDARIQAFCLTFDRPLRWEGVGMFLDMLIATRGDSLLRVKGILNLAGRDRPTAVHGVQHVFHDPVLLPAWPPGDDRHSRLVFVVRDLDRSVVEQGLRAFEAASGTP